MTGVIFTISGALIFTIGLIFYISVKKQPIQDQNIIKLQKPTEVMHAQPIKVENDSEMERQLNENDTIILKRKPQIPHDYFAVEVYRDNTKFGHFLRTGNKVVALMKDQGLELKPRIKKHRLRYPPVLACKTEVFI